MNSLIDIALVRPFVRVGELHDCSGRDAGTAPEIVDRGGLLSGHRD
jgi:hypothetical protein